MRTNPLLIAAAALAALPLLACSGDSPDDVIAGALGGSTTHQTSPAADPNTGITVQGVGSVRVAPDTAVLNIGVEVQADTVGEALDQAAVAADAVVASIIENGVDERDVQTTGLNIHARYDYGRSDDMPTLVGYVVSNTVSVTVRDLDRIGEIIDEAAAAGGNAIRINGIQFTVEDTAAATEQARTLAIEAAAQNAEQLAAAAGVEVGELLMITETSSNAPPPVFGGDVAEDAARTPVFSGTETVQVTVTVRYAIE